MTGREFGMSRRILGFVVIALMFTISNLANGQEKLTKFRCDGGEAICKQALSIFIITTFPAK